MPVEDRATKLALDAVVARVSAAGAVISRRGALIVQSAAQRRLHVGYGVVSGTMRRSIHTQGPEPRGPGVFATRVGPSVIYARRFELGFFGTDVLGRVYAPRGQQPPDRLGSIKRPFMAPAVRESRAAIGALATSQWRTAIRG
ncbi:MAG: hypothetical protein ABSB73_11645 [Solirubrobacteraceae bacterium]|jgi:hypothetical protein